jgi:hypothetical protein
MYSQHVYVSFYIFVGTYNKGLQSPKETKKHMLQCSRMVLYKIEDSDGKYDMKTYFCLSLLFRWVNEGIETDFRFFCIIGLDFLSPTPLIVDTESRRLCFSFLCEVAS